MRHNKPVTYLVILVSIITAVATTVGVLSRGGSGPYEYVSIRNELVSIYGRGLYKDMSAEVAPQGIAQDWVTLIIALPLLIRSLWSARRGSLRAQVVLAGTLSYFVVTYLFYLMMAMYNAMFLAYVAVLSASAFALTLCLISISVEQPWDVRTPVKLRKVAGSFLVFTSGAIAMLWLSIVIPPLFTGGVIPREVKHYTTLVVQSLDLSLLLPLGLVTGVLLIRGTMVGWLLAPTYLIFLALLMTALTAKIIAMGTLGYNIVPVVFIIPILNVTAVCLALLVLRSLPGQSMA